MRKEDIVKIFREITEKVDSGCIGAYYNSTFCTMPFTTVVNYMEFTNKSELEFAYNPVELAELSPTTIIHSSDVENIKLTKCKKEELFGKHEITFETNSGLFFVATVELKEGQKIELLKEENTNNANN